YTTLFRSLRLRRLDHERLLDQVWEVHGRRMVAEVHEALRQVYRSDASLRGELRGTSDELVLPEPAEGHVEDACESVTDVIRVQHGTVGNSFEPVSAHPEDVGVGPYQEREVPVPRAHFPDRLRAAVVQVVAAAVQPDHRHREERLEWFPDADGPGPRSSAAVGRREGLVQVEVDDVEIHFARRRAAQDGVEVRAVV